MTDSTRQQALPTNVLELADRFIVAIRYRHIDRNPDHTRPEIYIESRGHDSWALCWMGMCWDGNEWSYEPMPSNREDNWISKNRFTLSGAFDQARYAIADAKANSGIHGDYIESRIET